MINKRLLGLALGTFLGLCHFLWAWLVLTGLAQSLMNWIFQLHFIQPPYTLLPFNIGTAVALIVVTFVTGYASGWCLGAVWNWLISDAKRMRSMHPGKPATGH
jgi:hypothetical protein